MSESMALVGLDVHQAQTVAAVLDPVSGELRVERLRGVPSEAVVGFLEQLERPVRAVYEAGPTGFGLARAASERGLDLRVAAPGSIPRAPGDRVKTDRRDAKRLVRLFAAGELSFAFVPSEADEHFRDLVRCLDDVRRDLMRAPPRLTLVRRRARILRTGAARPGGRTAHSPCSRARGWRRGGLQCARARPGSRRERRMCSARSVQGGGLPAEGGLAGLAARQAGQDPRVIQIAWRAQRRLHARWTHLSERRGRRTVPIPSVLRGHLVEQRIRTADPDGRVFGAGSQPFSPTRVRDRAAKAWGRAECAPITLHEARHTFASLMIAAGVNAKALSTYMGHANIGITLDRYGHLMPGNEAEAAGLLDAYLEGAGS